MIASVNGWKINLMVCYDLRFPVWVRQQFDEEGKFEYDVLVYVANWPERRILAWKSLLRARAIENQCYAIGVNRIGNDGNDTLIGGGQNSLFGNISTFIYGDNGNDHLIGGIDHDIMSGGLGHDFFTCTGKQDMIVDFKSKEDNMTGNCLIL